MPATQWIEVVGKKCVSCGGPATWIYPSGDPMCCACYAGEGNGLVSREEAAFVHDFYERVGRLPEEQDYEIYFGKGV